ncbi:MAG: hypothetical protein ABSB99_07790 [Acidimicrobiales bacterium]
MEERWDEERWDEERCPEVRRVEELWVEGLLDMVLLGLNARILREARGILVRVPLQNRETARRIHMRLLASE